MLNVQLKKRWTLIQSVVFVMFLLSSTLAFAQNRVTGKVTDRTGMPLQNRYAASWRKRP